MKILSRTTVAAFLVIYAGVPLAATPVQQSGATGGGLPPSPFFGPIEHTHARNGSPAKLAAEAAKSQKWMADIAHGEAQTKAGDLDGAVNTFQQLITSDPNDGLAYRRMGEAYMAGGKWPQAGRAFHKFLIEGFGPGTNGGVGDTADEWAEYALVLVKTNQPAQAIQCYNHAAYLLDYEDSENHGGKPFLKVLLPEVVMERTQAEQVRYTPERLEALADTALAHEEWGSGQEKEAYAHTQEAVRLYPDSAVTHYYRGEIISGPIHAAEAKAEYQKAVELGDDQVTAAAKERLTQLP